MQNDRDLVQQSIYTSLKTYNISNYKHMKHILRSRSRRRRRRSRKRRRRRRG